MPPSLLDHCEQKDNNDDEQKAHWIDLIVEEIFAKDHHRMEKGLAEDLVAALTSIAGSHQESLLLVRLKRLPNGSTLNRNKS